MDFKYEVAAFTASEMEKAFPLALLLIVAAIGIHSVQAMTAYRNYEDQRYYEPNARFETPDGYENGVQVDNELDARARATVGCKYHAGMARWFCYKFGCNPGNPSDQCFTPMYCGQDSYEHICEEFHDCVESLPCMGKCK